MVVCSKAKRSTSFCSTGQDWSSLVPRFNFLLSDLTFWKHNGYWFFDSPEVIEQVAREESIDLAGTKIFYYEVYKQDSMTRKNNGVRF
ncbi:MAG: hypothetical protein A4E19_03115 [Nitrospira sp. SG-bin1]|nr:MAG: hypothetical protein A4E19_03115 [Nitrospira sp. SG-bin1]